MKESKKMDKEEARERLETIFYRLDHGPECTEPSIRWEDEDVGDRHPNRDGCLTVKCWNCHIAQDHFLYDES